MRQLEIPGEAFSSDYKLPTFLNSCALHEQVETKDVDTEDNFLRSAGGAVSLWGSTRDSVSAHRNPTCAVCVVWVAARGSLTLFPKSRVLAPNQKQKEKKWKVQLYIWSKAPEI